MSWTMSGRGSVTPSRLVQAAAYGVVTAVGSAGTSATVPGAPVSVSTAVGDTSVVVSWSPTSSDGGSPITGWFVGRDGNDSNGAGPWSTTVAASTSQFGFSNLVPGAVYTFTVRAINAVGMGAARTVTVTIPTPAPNQQVGAVALGGSSYSVPFPVPASYRFVDQVNGSDSNDGSQGAPVATIGKGCSLAPSGGTVVTLDGVYLEEVSVFKTLTVQAAPGAVVWLDGSVPVTGWTQNGSTWVHSGWSTAFTVTPSRYLVSAGDVQQHLDMVFLDGELMDQVPTGTTPAAGQFAVDYAADTITIGTNPSGHAIRATNKRTAYLVGTGAASGSLRGIGFRRYSQDSYDGRNGASVYIGGGTSGYVIENCWFDQMGFGALEMYKASSHKVRLCTFRRTAYGHIGGTVSDGSVVEYNYLTEGNYRQFKVANDNGCVKYTRCDQLIYRGNHCENNNGQTMLWVDVNVTRFTIVSNLLDASDQRSHTGVQIEESDGGFIGGVQYRSVVAGNTVINAMYGVANWASGHVDIWNNDFSLCSNYDVGLIQDRMWNNTDTYRSQAESPWLTQGMTVCNNLLRSSSAVYELDVQDQGPLMPSATWYPAGQQPTGRPATQMVDAVKTNVFVGTAGTTKMVALANGTNGAITVYKDLPTVQTFSGKFVGNLSYPTLPTTLPHSSATPLPQNIADALGVPVGTTHLGPL